MHYELRVAGRLTKDRIDAFPELDHVMMPGQTVLYGHVVDEAHLYGLLARCRSLGLRLLEVRPAPR
ncbi:hypothetical protein ABZ606_08240 [Streptomyces sp. NPDC012461]|uniref:hypothetical protein n=1 Tax=unclassified Streptomyces TaxID=2593676 RepID=UPI0013DC6C1E|nr:hypothetical protein [Streptomyces sp. SID9913]NED20495.1 hypothetical protein [Streptomyces sp. SID9913]